MEGQRRRRAMDGPTSRSHRGRALPPRAPADADPPAEVVPCHRGRPPPQLRRLSLRPCASAAAYTSPPAAIGRWNVGWWYPKEPPLRRSRSSDAPSAGLPSPPTDKSSHRVKGGREPPPPPPEESDGGVTRFTASRVALRAFDGESRLAAARSERRRWAGLAPVRVALVSAPLLTCAVSNTLIKSLGTYHLAAVVVNFGSTEKCLPFF